MSIPRYRIGNDLSVLWAVNNRDGSPYNLDGKEVHLFVTNDRGRYEVPVIIETLEDGTTNNVVRWDFRGEQQRVLGTYTLTLEITNTADSKEIKRDKSEAFSLVCCSESESIEDGEPNIQDGGELILATKLDIYRFGVAKIEIGVNGNWFIDGVDTGRPSFAGEGLVNKIYKATDFGGIFAEDSKIDTFNAYAINSLFLGVSKAAEDITDLYTRLEDVIVGGGDGGSCLWRVDAAGNLWTDRNVYSTKEISAKGLNLGPGGEGGASPDLSILNNYLLKTEAAELYLIKDAAKDFASVSSVTDLSNALVQLSETYGNRLNALEKIIQWFHLTQDEQAIYTEKNFYSEKEISAHGLNLGGGSGEGGAIELGNIIGVSLHSPVTGDVFVYNGTHWTNISQSELVPDLSGYATTDSVSTVSNRVNTVDNKVKSLEDRLNDLESEKFFFKLEGTNDVIYTPYNLFSEKEISAHGLNYGSGSGASGLLTDLLDVKAEDSTSGDLLVFDGTHWINTPQSAIVPSIDTSVIATREWVGENYASTSDLSNGVKDSKAYTDALRTHVNEQDQILSGQISKILDWFSLENDVLLTKYNLASEKEVSAKGINASQGGGTSYNRLDSWSAYDSSKAGYVLSALLGYDLHTRLISVENRTVDLSGYYTKAQTDAKISSAIAGIDLTPYATTAALNKAIIDLNISQYAKSADVASTYATIAALNTLEGKHNTLRNEFNALSNLLSSDTSDYINTWNEVVAFLDGYKDEADLATILSGMNADISSRLLTSTFTTWQKDTFTPLSELVAKHTTRLNGIDTSITNINTRIDGVESEFDTFLAEYNAFRANFEISDDLILVRKNFASTEEISAHGINQGTGGGGGSSFSRLDAWADYDSNKAGYVLSAYLGHDLNSRLTVVENKKVDLSGYYTKEQTDAKISSAVGAIDFTPYAKSADVAKTYATIAALNLIDGRVGTLEKAGYATTGYVDSAVSGIDFTPYAKKKDVADTYATKESLTSSIKGLNISQYAKSSDVAQTYATKNELTSSIKGLDISQYATTVALEKAISDLKISQYAKTDDVASTYATIAALNGLTGLHNTLRGEFDALNSLLNDDTAGVIDSWNEVVDFINEYSGSDDLETILAGMNTNIASRLLASDFNTWVANTYTPLANRVGVAEGYITSLQTLTGTHTTQISGLTTRMGTAEENISNNATAIANNKSDIDKLLGWFKIDSDGNVYTEHNFYSTQQISAKGLNAGGGSGSSYNRLDAWTDYDSSKAGYVLSALLGYDLHSRVTTLENKKVDLSDYYTKAQTDSKISSAVGAIDFSPYATKGELSSSIAELNVAQYAKITDVSKTYATKNELSSAISGIDFSPYATKGELSSAIAGIDFSPYAKTSDIAKTYATKNELSVAIDEINKLDLNNRVQIIENSYVSKNIGGVINGELTVNSLAVAGGTSSQFLKADGSLDSNTYLTSVSWSQVNGRPTNLSQFTDDVVSGKYLSLTGGTLTGILTVGGASIHPTVGNPYFQLYQNNKYWYWQADDNYTYIGGTMRKALQIDQEGNTTIIGQLTASNINGYTPITSGNYSQYALPLTGGTLRGKLYLHGNEDQNYITFQKNGATQGYLGFNGVDNPMFIPSAANVIYPLIHSGNYSQYAPTLTGTGASGTWGISAYGLAKVGANASGRYNANELTSGGMMVNGSSWALWDNAPIEDAGSIIHFSPNRELYYSLQLCVNGWTHDLFVRNFTPDGVWNGWKQLAFTDSNVASAQALTHSNGKLYASSDGSTYCAFGMRGSINYIDGTECRMGFGASAETGFVLGSLGGVTIGYTDLAGTDYKFYVAGSGYFSGALTVSGTTKSERYLLSNSEDSYCGLMPNSTITASGNAEDIWLYNNQAVKLYGGKGVIVASSFDVQGAATFSNNVNVHDAITIEAGKELRFKDNNGVVHSLRYDSNKQAFVFDGNVNASGEMSAHTINA